MSWRTLSIIIGCCTMLYDVIPGTFLRTSNSFTLELLLLLLLSPFSTLQVAWSYHRRVAVRRGGSGTVLKDTSIHHLSILYVSHLINISLYESWTRTISPSPSHIMYTIFASMSAPRCVSSPIYSLKGYFGQGSSVKISC